MHYITRINPIKHEKMPIKDMATKYLQNELETSMHSSRMHTAYLLAVSWGDGVCLDANPHGGRSPPSGGRLPSGGRSSTGGRPPPLQEADPLRRQTPPGHVTSDICWKEADPTWTEWLIHACEKITSRNFVCGLIPKLAIQCSSFRCALWTFKQQLTLKMWGCWGISIVLL